MLAIRAPLEVSLTCARCGYAGVKERIDGRRAALSEARKIVRHACHILTDLAHSFEAVHVGPLPATGRGQ
jgi:hypothetical protein